MRGDCLERDAEPSFTYLPNGWLWTARVRPNLYHWTRLVTAPLPIQRESPPLEFAALEPVGCPKGAEVTWRRLESSAGPGYFVVGDAAARTDPSSSHGVLRAIMSGMLAGYLVLKRAVQKEPQGKVIEEYQTFVGSSFAFDWARSSRLRHVAHWQTTGTNK
jgi:hypothetical protein